MREERGSEGTDAETADDAASVVGGATEAAADEAPETPLPACADSGDGYDALAKPAGVDGNGAADALDDGGDGDDDEAITTRRGDGFGEGRFSPLTRVVGGDVELASRGVTAAATDAAVDGAEE